MLPFVTWFHRCPLVKTHSADQDVILNISLTFVKAYMAALAERNENPLKSFSNLIIETYFC